MARQAADAYTTTPYVKGSVLILKSGVNDTCDAVPLPTLANNVTTSLLGSGSKISSIVKKQGCPPTKATLSHNDPSNGALSHGVYEGFTVDANHIDAAACEFYGMSLTTVMDVACGNAVAGSDHELEFGNRDANSTGWMDNIYIYSLKTFDSVQAGSGAALAPVWFLGSMNAVTLANPGTLPYTSQYVRAQVYGPDTATCSRLPTLVPTLDSDHHVSGAVITDRGSCASTNHIYILVQDGTPITYSMKFTNMADSHAWTLAATNAATYGVGWLDGSNNNSIYNELAGGNQVIAITDNGNGNRHVNPVISDPLGYAVGIYSQNGTFANVALTWTASNGFLAASGYYLGNDHRVYHDWAIDGSKCIGNASADFVPIVTENGLFSAAHPLPAGVKPQNIEDCDGTGSMAWATNR